MSSDRRDARDTDRVPFLFACTRRLGGLWYLPAGLHAEIDMMRDHFPDSDLLALDVPLVELQPAFDVHFLPGDEIGGAGASHLAEDRDRHDGHRPLLGSLLGKAIDGDAHVAHRAGPGGP